LGLTLGNEGRVQRNDSTATATRTNPPLPHTGIRGFGNTATALAMNTRVAAIFAGRRITPDSFQSRIGGPKHFCTRHAGLVNKYRPGACRKLDPGPAPARSEGARRP
jgi:hypothetical protein